MKKSSNFFNGLRGIVLLDTLGEPEKLKRDAETLQIDLKILETRKIGLENLKQVLLEAIKENKQKYSRKDSP